MDIYLYKRGLSGKDYIKEPVLFEVEKTDVYDIYKRKDGYYIVCMLSNGNNLAAIEKIDYYPKGEEKFNSRNTICPYCGFEDLDSWELDSDSGETECGRCGSEFSFERIVSVDFKTFPLKVNDKIIDIS